MEVKADAFSLRAFRRGGKLVIEIDEHRFCADAFQQSESRLLDRDAFLAFACENLFSVLHDATAEERTWWVSLCQAVDQGAADAGAGVRLEDGGEDRLPVAQPPDLFPDEVTRELLGVHVKPVALSAWCPAYARGMKTGEKSSRREAIRLGELWKVAVEMGMAQREIICLQDGHSRGELATMFNLSPGRISQIKAKAIRKMRHPWRVRLAIELGLTEKLGLTEEEFYRASARSLAGEIALPEPEGYSDGG